MKTRDEQTHEYAVAKLQEFKATSNGNSNARERLICFGTETDAFLAGWDAALINQWRDAREEWPEKSGDYLVSYENGVKAIVYWDSFNKDWQDYNGESIDNYDEIVKCWMPIPELP